MLQPRQGSRCFQHHKMPHHIRFDIAIGINQGMPDTRLGCQVNYLRYLTILTEYLGYCRAIRDIHTRK
jgi:hypothetical protein